MKELYSMRHATQILRFLRSKSDRVMPSTQKKLVNFFLTRIHEEAMLSGSQQEDNYHHPGFNHHKWTRPLSIMWRSKVLRAKKSSRLISKIMKR